MRFALLLARTLGRTLQELEESCTAHEFALWMALYEAEPWGPVREDMAAGVIASTIANVNRGKDQAAFKPLDFMPLIKQPEKQEEATSADFLREFLPPG